MPAKCSQTLPPASFLHLSSEELPKFPSKLGAFIWKRIILDKLNELLDVSVSNWLGLGLEANSFHCTSVSLPNRTHTSRSSQAPPARTYHQPLQQHNTSAASSGRRHQHHCKRSVTVVAAMRCREICSKAHFEVCNSNHPPRFVFLVSFWFCFWWIIDSIHCVTVCVFKRAGTGHSVLLCWIFQFDQLQLQICFQSRPFSGVVFWKNSNGTQWSFKFQRNNLPMTCDPKITNPKTLSIPNGSKTPSPTPLPHTPPPVNPGSHRKWLRFQCHPSTFEFRNGRQSRLRRAQPRACCCGTTWRWESV